MNFCDEHWQRLHAALGERGLTHLISQSGDTAGKRFRDQIKRRDVTQANFDPLLSAWSEIAVNVIDMLSDNAMDPLYVLVNPEDPEDLIDTDQFPAAEGKTWPKCGLCYVNLAHELSCKHDGCELDLVNGFDYMIERAADDQLQHAIELNLIH